MNRSEQRCQGWTGLSRSSESLFDVETLRRKLEDINYEVETPGFWDDIERAGKTMKEKKRLESEIGGYDDCRETLAEIELTIDMAEEAGDQELADEASESFAKLEARIEDLRIQTLLTEEYDTSPAIVAIHSGAGGLDAQDWAEMLLRMYMRWAEKKGYSITTLDIQDDPEAGIKSATIRIEGEYAYGYLKNERGVHRLVRISPFNADKKRQTSFASVDVTPELSEDVKVEIDPEDIRVDTFRASGAGGQYINRTDSAVRITHLPTNIVVTCQNERSQRQNKEYAMRMLVSKLYALAKQEHMDKISDLKGNFSQITWGSQIRSYVLQPYTMVKDHRTGAETANVSAVLDGDLDSFMNASLNQLKKGENDG